MVFDAISSNIDQSSHMLIAFGDLNILHKDWLTYSGETDRSGELCYNFSISNDVNQMVNFPIKMPDCDLYSPALLDFFCLMLVLALQWLPLHWEILIMLLSQFPLTVHQIHNRMPHFIKSLRVLSR